MREDIVSFISETTESEAPFFIEMTGISYCDDSYCITRKISSFYVFEYILEGEGTVIVDGKSFTAKKGDIYILSRNSNHKYFSDKLNPWTKIWFNAKGSLIDSLVKIYRLNSVNHIQDIDVSSLFFQIFSKAKDVKISKVHFIEETSILFHQLILTLSPSDHKESSLAYSKEANILKEYLDKNNMNKVEIKDLCKQIYHSPSQTIRIFKKAYGITPYQYLMSQKLELAKLFLLNTNKSIKVISMELNFYDEHYFSKFFKEKVGISPLKYRKTNH